MPTPVNSTNLSRGIRALAAALGVTIVLFGGLVVWRSCFMSARHTDFGVYARAGWATRTGHDIYQVADTGGLHYCYPPPFAILMSPFAEPPPDEASGRFVPFAVSVTIWYLLSVAFAFIAAHVLASAVETTMSNATSRRRWWELRLFPVLIILPALGNNLSHGQVNSLLLLLVACMLAALIRGQSRSAGAWLAAAISLKVIPAFLLLMPLMRRDRRFAAGLMLGLIVMLVGVPAAVWGPVTMWKYNRKFVDVMIHPAVAGAEQSDRAVEMFHVLKTDNQSMQAVLHAWQHWGNANAPAESSRRTRAIHWLLGLAMTVTTCLAARRRLMGNDLLLLGGALATVMLFVSPMCHLHYYVLTMPLVTGLMVAAWQSEDQVVVRRCQLSFAIHIIGNVIPLVFEPYRNLGFAPLSTLPLWALAVNELRRPRVAAVAPTIELRKAA